MTRPTSHNPLGSHHRARSDLDVAVTVVVVGGEPTATAGLVGGLRSYGYTVESRRTGYAAMRLVGSCPPDVVLVDIDVGDMPGVTLCRWIRSEHPDVAVIFVTASGSDSDIVAGLDAGANDYVVTPCSLAVLVARVHTQVDAARLRRGVAPMMIRGLRIDPRAHCVFLDDRELELRPKQFALLVALVRRAGTVVTREQLLGEVWDLHGASPTKTLAMHISELRRLLSDDPAAPTWITTVRSVGYRFETQ